MYLEKLYGSSLSLLTDLYQLTMAGGYWENEMVDKEAVFHLYYRKNPFNSGYAIAAGLETAVEYLQNLSFDEEDVAYLSELTGNDDEKLFEPEFLDYLRDFEFTCDVDAVPEGKVVFPNEPLVRVKGPLIQCQLVETPLLNIVNFQTLIATKASRIARAAEGEPVLEFGLRRAQGIDGSIMASRAAYIGGCAATSNVLAGKLLGIPVKGTHAHSWVMAFDSEMESFERYAEAMPNNCVFLVDTYDTLEGVKKAIDVSKKLRERGHEVVGIRLDSGDLAYLSIEARKLLDDAGFEDAKIVASNSLDENVIQSLKRQGAKITVWGVGTRLATAYDQPALGGVYKLAAIRDPGGFWEYKIKLSEQRIKISNPGSLQVRRYIDEDGKAAGDMIYNEFVHRPDNHVITDPMDDTRQKDLEGYGCFDKLLKPVMSEGECVYDFPDLEATRLVREHSLSLFHDGIKRFENPHEYPVGLSKGLHQKRTELIRKARGTE